MIAAKHDWGALPKIVLALEVIDGGEGGGASCPHCGATGRWIHRFLLADGTRAGAMRGCFRMWPKHPFAAEAAAIQAKAAKLRPGWKLASWDERILQAIERFAAGALAEASCSAEIRAAKARFH